MTDDQIAAALAPVRDRERKATRGPWKVEREHLHDMDDAPFSLPSVTGPDGREIFGGCVDQPGADLRFAAHAREDVPRLLAALEAALSRHRPEQLYRTVEDFNGNVTCGHDGDYDGDAHFEGDDGVWYCKGKPTVTVCVSCCDESDSDLRAAWPCPTYADAARELAGKEAPVAKAD